jgi:hypothetical protein
MEDENEDKDFEKFLPKWYLEVKKLQKDKEGKTNY